MIKRFIIFLLYAVVMSSTFAASNTDINRLINNQLKKAQAGDLNLGIYVENLDTGKEKFSKHSRRFFVPASVTKIFTAYTILKYLGMDYKISTEFYSEKAPKHLKLNSDLYIKFYGDPTFTYSQLVDSLKALDIKYIYGNVVIDDSFFDENSTSPGGFSWDDSPFYYAAPKSAVIIDKNTSEAFMKPSESIDSIAELRIDRPHVLEIINNVKTVKHRGEECPYKSRYISNNKYEVYGCMFSDMSKEVRLNFALQDTKLMAKNYVQRAIKESGIKLHGNVIIGNSKKGKVIYKHLSTPIKDFLKYILTESCNITSAAVFKHMAAISTTRPGNDEDGELIMKRVLANDGIKNSEFYFRDGSGESRYNLVTPKAVVQLLKLAYNNTKFKKDFIDALPKYGHDGTLSYRGLEGEYGSFVHAKTGSFKGVSALAGYYLPKKGPKYVFAIMSNNFRLSYTEIKALEDKILYILLKN